MAVTPFSTWRPVSNRGGAMSAHIGLVLHVQEGNNSPYGWFSNPQSQASSTWWVSKSGVIEQYVDTSTAAWAQGSGNATWNSVETEGYVAEALTDAQLRGVAQIYSWGAQQYGWPMRVSDSPSTGGLGTHGMGGQAWGGHGGCPGATRAAQRQQIITIASGSAPPPTPQGEPDMFITGSPTGKGYYCAKTDGSVFAFGDAKYAGGINNAGPGGKSAMPSGQSVTDLAVSSAGGYWLIIANGSVYAFGGAPYFGNVK